jgi:hypothetical protein
MRFEVKYIQLPNIVQLRNKTLRQWNLNDRRFQWYH